MGYHLVLIEPLNSFLLERYLSFTAKQLSKFDQSLGRECFLSIFLALKYLEHIQNSLF